MYSYVKYRELQSCFHGKQSVVITVERVNEKRRKLNEMMITERENEKTERVNENIEN